MLSNIRYSNWHLICLSFLTLVVVLLAVFSNLSTSPENMNIFFCSDTLYLPSIYQDWFKDQTNMDGWHLNPAPNYFPDMPLYFFLMFVTGNFITSSFLFSFIQYLFLAYLFIRILKVVFPSANKYSTLLICTLLTFYLLEGFFYEKNFLYLFYIIVNSYHAGAFVVTLLSLFFSFKYIQSKKIGWLLLITITGFLMVISDRLFIVLYVIPTTITLSLLYKRLSVKTTLSLIASNFIFTVFGIFVFNSIDSSAYKHVGSLGNVSLELIAEQLRIFFVQMRFMLTHFSVSAFTLYLFLVSFILMIWVFFRSIKKDNSILISCYALFSLIFSPCVLFAPILSGKYVGDDCLRYNIYPFYLAILNIAIFINFIKTDIRITKAACYTLIILNCLLLFYGISRFRYSGLKEFFNYYPESAKLVDDLAEKEGLTLGVAEYWEAKKITLFSKKNVKVRAVFEDVSLYPHAANEHWYFDNVFSFAILNNFKDTSTYKTKLENIQVICNTKELKLIKTQPFTYKREIGSEAITINSKN